MGLIGATLDSLGGVFSDQWKDVITARKFDEHDLVVPGKRKELQNGRGNNYGAQDILSNGSVIYVPENTAAFIFSESGIEEVISQPGGYEYHNGEASVFNEKDRQERGIAKILVGQAAERIGFSGMTPIEKKVAFLNLREIRGIKFGTRGPLAYHDNFYGTDLEIYSYGSFSIKVSDPEKVVRNFVPANTRSYSFDSWKVREQLLAEFLHSFIAATNALSKEYRISQLPAQVNDIADIIATENRNAGTWEERFGLKLVALAIENIEFSEASRELVHTYSEHKMSVSAYEGISAQAGNMAAQQLIAEGVKEKGMGEAGNMLFGMGFAQSLNPLNAVQGAHATGAAVSGAHEQPEYQEGPKQPAHQDEPRVQAAASAASLDEKIEALKKFKDLLDMGILTQEEFDAKKKELLGL